MQIDLRKEALGRIQDIVGFPDECLHQLSRNRAGGIDCDHELPDRFDLLVFQRLDQRHFFIKPQPVGVENIVEFLVIDPHGLAKNRKFPKECCVVIFLPVYSRETLHQTVRRGPAIFFKGLQLHLDPFGDLLPALCLLRPAFAGRRFCCLFRSFTCTELFLDALRRQIPECVIIRGKNVPELCEPHRIRRGLTEICIELLGGHMVQIMLDRLKILLLFLLPRRFHRLDPKAGDHILRRNVTG